MSRRLEGALAHRVARAREAVTQYHRRLEALSPEAVLARGYALCYCLPGGSIIRAASELRQDDRIRVRLARGSADARVEGIAE